MAACSHLHAGCGRTACKFRCLLLPLASHLSMDQPKKTLVGERTLAYIALLLLSICSAEACESPIFVACLEHEMQAVKVRVKILLVFKVVTMCVAGF